MKKYEFTGEEKNIYGVKLKRIKRISDGKIGGWIEKEDNLSHFGKSWIYDEAIVYGNSKIYGNAEIRDSVFVYGNAKIYDNAEVSGYADISENTIICENAKISEIIRVFGDIKIYGDANISGKFNIHGNVRLYGGNISKSGDYMVFKNNLTSGIYYTYNFTNDIWVIGYFVGDTNELKECLNTNENELQKIEYGMAIDYIEKLKKIKHNMIDIQ